MIDDNLRKLGFSQNEVKMYLSLFRLGKTKAGDLIKETSLQRSVIYTGLERLSDRGLVSKAVSRGVTVYVANDPEALVYEAEQHSFLAKKVSEELKQKQQIKDREVVVYEGEDIVKIVANKYLEVNPGSTIYFFGSSKFGVQTNLEKYWQHYHKKRVEKGINCKILYEQNTDPRIVENRNTLSLCEARYLPLNTEMPMSFIVSYDKVGMIVPSEEPPLAFLIKSKKTAEGLKKYFDYLWEQSKKLV